MNGSFAGARRLVLLVAAATLAAAPRAAAQILGSTRTDGPSCVFYQPPVSTLDELSVAQAINTLQTTLWRNWRLDNAGRIEVTDAQIAGYRGDRARYFMIRDLDPRLHFSRATITNESFWSGKTVEKQETSYVINVVSGNQAGQPAFSIPEREGPNAADMRHVVDALYVLHAQTRMQWRAGYQEKFNQAVPVYTKMATKPELPEEARRYAVQGRALTKSGDPRATNVLEQALDIVPWWAEGHFNLALAYEAKEDYAAAIVEMKRYLTLEPRAQDARDMQDKIYEWELLGNKATNGADAGCGGAARGGTRR